VPTYKIVVTGPFNSGKTQFVRTGSDIPVIETEKNITTEDRGIKAQTTVAMDFGRVELGDGNTAHLFGTPGQTRFSFMWEILAKEMNGFIVLVDSTDTPSFPEAAELIRQFSSFVDVPYLIVANKSDLEGAVPTEAMHSGMRLSGDQDIMSCVALDKASVMQVIDKMLALIRQ